MRKAHTFTKDQTLSASLVELEQLIEASCKLVAPTWPLQHTVAVNPFWFFIERHYCEVMSELASTLHQSLHLPLSRYQTKYAAGDIDDQSLAEALRLGKQRWHSLPENIEEFKKLSSQDRPFQRYYPTFAEQLLSSTDWLEIIQSEFGKVTAAYFDEKQSIVPFPWRKGDFWSSWFSLLDFDDSMHRHGLKSFRERIKTFAKYTPLEAIHTMLESLGIENARGRYLYMQRLCVHVLGWASHFRYLEWQKNLGYEIHQNAQLIECLAVRMLYDYAVFLDTEHRLPELCETWVHNFNHPQEPSDQEASLDFALGYIWQTALEKAYQKRIALKLGRPARSEPHSHVRGEPHEHARGQPNSREERSTHTSDSPQQPKAQCVFCIDVRSEVIRRHIENIDPEIHTIGFAGFFGLAVEYHSLTDQKPSSRLPVLLPPAVSIKEELTDTTSKDTASTTCTHPHPSTQTNPNGGSHAHHLTCQVDRQARSTVTDLMTRSYFRNLRKAPFSSFLFVELFGVLSVENMIRKTWRALSRRIRGHRLPNRFQQTAQDHNFHALLKSNAGVSHEEWARRLAGILRGMGLTKDFALTVCVVGHGSDTSNNAFNSSLDCGACGGHAGDVNARLLASLLNQQEIRVLIKSQSGIVIPHETTFVAAVHETVTDEIYVLNEEGLPSLTRNRLASIKQTWKQASARARAERSISRSDVLDRAAIRRAANWSEVRPEWGLAGNAAFLVAPRRRSVGKNMAGRSFLHDYDWRQDKDFAILEQIMTAPMVVTNWINMQYFASVVAPDHFGSGSKVLHNLVNETGVVEGNGGNLRTGLPLQSVHDGEEFVHEPLRLSVFIEAPQKAIEDIIAKHPVLQHLIDHQWLHVLRIEPLEKVEERLEPFEAQTARISRRYAAHDYRAI